MHSVPNIPTPQDLNALAGRVVNTESVATVLRDVAKALPSYDGKCAVTVRVAVGVLTHLDQIEVERALLERQWDVSWAFDCGRVCGLLVFPAGRTV